MIDPYEKIIMIMRNQSEGSITSGFTMGEMTSATSCQIGDLKLTKDELLYLNGGSYSKGDTVLVAVTDEQYIILGKVVEK